MQRTGSESIGTETGGTEDATRRSAESENVGDQRGQNFGGGFGGGGFGGGGLGMLIGLVGSRFGIGGIVVVVIGMMLFGMNPLSLVGGGGSTGGGDTAITREGAAKACAADASSKFSCEVLGSTEDTWSKLFHAQGAQYRPAGLIFYSGSGSSGCGAAQSAMGPFYCPTDQRIYLDPGFFSELQTRFHAAGDFAQAYVIAHEVGHNVQYLDGTAAKVQAGQKAAAKPTATPFRSAWNSRPIATQASGRQTTGTSSIRAM